MVRDGANGTLDDEGRRGKIPDDQSPGRKRDARNVGDIQTTDVPNESATRSLYFSFLFAVTKS